MALRRNTFPLSFKLSLVVSALLVFSLGAVIFSVWFLIRSDLRNTAIADNAGINFRAAAAADAALEEMAANTSLFLDGIGSIEDGLTDKRLLNFFFAQNPRIAAVVSISAEGKAATFINGTFTRANEISNSLIADYVSLKGREFLRSTGEVLLMNAAPDFYGLPVLAAGFPLTSGGLVPSMALVFFSAEDLGDFFGSGANTSVLINSRGDILIHPDQTEGNMAANPAFQLLVDSRLPAADFSANTLFRENGELFFASVQTLAFSGAAVITSIPAGVVFEGINATAIRNLYFALAVWSFSLLLFRFFARHLTAQLKNLEESARAIENGFYRRSILVKSRDEAGLLSQSMDSMRVALLNFQRFTNKEIARLTRKGLLSPGGSSRTGTFLFSDIRSFTAISETMEPASVVEFLNGYMDHMVACVMVTGGVIDKFIGDAIMAHWGVVDTAEGQSTEGRRTTEGRSNEENARSAIRAALLMRAALQCFNRGRGSDKKPLIKTGCGISSGPVAAGQIGTGERLEYTVIGGTVSLADHTEAFNKPFGTEILITGDTQVLTRNAFVTEELPSITENGKKVRLFAVVNVRDPEETKRFLEELESLPDIDMPTARRYAGPGGPKNLKDLRTLLGIAEPDLSRIRTDEREKKFKVQKS